MFPIFTTDEHNRLCAALRAFDTQGTLDGLSETDIKVVKLWHQWGYGASRTPPREVPDTTYPRLRNCYTFYDLAEEERKAMVGKPFVELCQPLRKNGCPFGQNGMIYFPVDLEGDEKYRNYNMPQGLIFVTYLWGPMGGKNQNPNWFRVGVTSPDDLDIDLDFNPSTMEEAQRLRQIAIDFLSDPDNCRNVTYNGLLDFINELCGGVGERTS